jgi:hypothetical protein
MGRPCLKISCGHDISYPYTSTTLFCTPTSVLCPIDMYHLKRYPYSQKRYVTMDSHAEYHPHASGFVGSSSAEDAKPYN